MSIATIAEHYVAAMVAKDYGAVFALKSPEAITWRNVDGVERTQEEMRAHAATEQAAAPALDFSSRHVLLNDDGFTWLATVSLPGAEPVVPICLVVTVQDDLIVRTDEYLDSAQVAALASAAGA